MVCISFLIFTLNVYGLDFTDCKEEYRNLKFSMMSIGQDFLLFESCLYPSSDGLQAGFELILLLLHQS